MDSYLAMRINLSSISTPVKVLHQRISPASGHLNRSGTTGPQASALPAQKKMGEPHPVTQMFQYPCHL